MWGILEAISAFLIAVGVLAFGWLLFGHMVMPAKDGVDTKLFCLLRAEGDADGLQQTVGSLRWMDGSRLMRAQIIIVDAGLSAEGRKMAEYIARQEPDIVLCESENLSPHILEG